MSNKFFMQWRQILFSFAILFGSALWALPFSVSAFDICISDNTPGCPTGSSPASPISPCFIQPVGNTPEHRCSSTVNSCLASSGGSCLSACGTDTFVDNNCAAATGCSQKWCVNKVQFAAAVTAAGAGNTITSCGSTGSTCQTSCGTLTEDTTGTPACIPNSTNRTCCKPTAATPPPDCTANPTATGCVKTTVKNPLSFSTVEGVLGSVLSTLQAIIVVLALISIVIGGILYVTSAGDDERMKTAKGAITAAAIGLALGLAAPSFLKQIGDILGWTAVIACPATLPAADLATCQAAQAALAAGKPLSAIVLSALQFLLSIVGVLGIIMLVIGGLTYLTSAGNEEQSESGKKIVTYAIIGIAVALASLIAVTQIAGLFVP